MHERVFIKRAKDDIHKCEKVFLKKGVGLIWQKVIAIGNRLMMDDAVGVVILEKIKNILEDKGIEGYYRRNRYRFLFFKIKHRR